MHGGLADRNSTARSTGVQFGGPASQSGVIGVWTSADHSPESPTGPFWCVDSARRVCGSFAAGRFRLIPSLLGRYWPHIRPE